MVASAARGSIATAPGYATGGRSWQDDAFHFYDALGEIHEAAKFAARPLSKLELKVEELNPDGEWEDSENPDAIDILDNIKGADGTRSELFFAYGQLMFLTGETWLVGTDDADGNQVWEFLSTAELKPVLGEKGAWKRYAYPGAAPTDLYERLDDAAEPRENEAAIYRFWRRHPMFSSEADCPMRGVRTICAELEILTKSVRGEALSRLASAGILWLPEEMSLPSPDSGPDEDAELDTLLKDLTDAAREAIKDPSSASAMVPIIARVTGDRIAQIARTTFGSAGDGYPEAKLRDEAITRLAIGLDMPVEALTGAGGTNHWTVWMIDDQSWRVHVQPLADLLVGNLTATVFRPELANEGIVDPASFRIAYDASSIVTDSDKGKDAKDLHDRGAINDAALREAVGFDDEDQPTVDEPNSNPAVIIAEARAAGFGGPSTYTGEPTNEPGAPMTERPATAPTPAGGGSDVVKQPPAATGSPLAAAVNGNGHAGEDPFAMAARMAVDECRKRAGSRIRSKAAKDPQVSAQLKGVSNRLVATVVGEATATLLTGESPGALVAGGAETFHAALVAWGIDEAEASELTAAVEAHAAGTLFDAEPACVPPSLERVTAA